MGIEPDLEVPAARIDLIDEGKRRSEADLRGALNNDTVKPQQAPANQNAPAGEQAPQATPQAARPPALGDDNDYQLIRAVDLLRGLHMFNKRAVN